jgi:Ni/Co efflux regulator RcnB
MSKLLGSLVVIVALSFLGVPSLMAADQTVTTVQKDGDKDKDGKPRKHRRHHHKHHHRHHKHTPPKTDSKTS